jgi:polyphosphate kinase
LLCNQNRQAPDLRDQFIYLAVELLVAHRNQPIYAFIEVPTDILPRFIVLPKRGNDDCVILLEDVIRHCLGDIFALLNPTKCSAWNVTVTRDSELDIDDDSSDNYMDQVHRGLRKRRTGAPVRMVYDEGLPQRFLKHLVNKMKIERDKSLIPGRSYHNFKDFIHFPKLGRDRLVSKRVAPVAHPALQGCSSVLAVIAEGDILLHYPYHGFGSFVELLREAALDLHVIEIAMTVYRVSPTSNVLNALINAARNGKHVIVVIELLARFDEENNLEWVNRLRDEGVEVITGVRGLKVHAKLCLVTRRQGKRLMRFATIGTGNFNENTAQVYTDHILMTSNPSITHEVERLFAFFRSNYKVAEFQHLIVSPFKSRSCWRQLIHQEIRNARQDKPASVWIKLNNFADPKLVGELYEASQAGVQVRLIVRSMHTLIPGLTSISDRIEGISIVGRYLEHSRFLVFCNAGRPRVYITSGDWLPRNFEERVEVACPIKDPALAAQLIDYFNMQWDDTDNARVWDSSLSNRRRPLAPNAIQRNCHEGIRAYVASLASPTTRECFAPVLEIPIKIPQVNDIKPRPAFADLKSVGC